MRTALARIPTIKTPISFRHGVQRQPNETFLATVIFMREVNGETEESMVTYPEAFETQSQARDHAWEQGLAGRFFPF
jgi:hypothetical protein